MDWEVDITKCLAVGIDGITFKYKSTELISITNIPQWVDHKDLYLLTKEANFIYGSKFRSETCYTHKLNNINATHLMTSS